MPDLSPGRTLDSGMVYIGVSLRQFPQTLANKQDSIS